MISLYPDQEEFIQEIRKAWVNHIRFVAYLPTGGGKTRVAARIIEQSTNRGLRVCFLVPRITLVGQTVREFNKLGLTDIGVLQGDTEYDDRAKITVASIDTYIRRDKQKFDLVVVDEAHHRRVKLLEWMSQYEDERYIGLTATPYADWMGDYYSGLAKGKSMRWLIDNNRLSDYDVYAPDIPDTSKLRSRYTSDGLDYIESELESLMGDAKVVGNIVQNWLENGGNRLTMALCVNVNHANHLCVEFKKAGISCEVITAKVPIEERERIFQRMRDGILRVLMSVDCLTEGFDMPEVSCLINARPTKSKMRYVQGFGRVMRYVDGKRAIIFDHSGTTLKLGLPEDISIDELLSGGREGAKHREREEEEKSEKKPKPCPSCKHIKPAGVGQCPKCGFTPIAGEDVEVADGKLKAIKKDKAKKICSMEDKQKFYSELYSYYIQKTKLEGKGWSEGWIANQYKSKFGVWPRGMNKVGRTPSPETINWIKSQWAKYKRSKRIENGIYENARVD